MQRYFNMRPHLLSRLATIYSQLGDLYDRLDKKRAGRPSDERDQAITELAKDIEAGEKLLKAAKLEETEGGVGGDKPPGGKPPATAEQPHEEGDQPEDREAIFRREIGNVLVEQPEHLVGMPRELPDSEGFVEGLFRATSALFGVKDLKALLLGARDTNQENLLVESISLLSAIHDPTTDLAYHIEILAKECKAANWPAVREKLAVIRTLCKE